MFNFLGKKEKESIQNNELEKEEEVKTPIEEKKDTNNELIINNYEEPSEGEQALDLGQQCIDLALDIKEDVRKSTKAFFNSRNKDKASAYLKFEKYLEELPRAKTYELKNLGYIDFKEKEEKIYFTLKNGFAQFISKGATLNEETRKIVDFVFGDIKKFPSKGHRFWYYKIYIWQKRQKSLD